jgi:hypothetical protein
MAAEVDLQRRSRLDEPRGRKRVFSILHEEFSK